MFSSPPPQLQDTDITIVGLGLMGGSLALALKPYIHTLTAVEADAATRRLATEQCIVDRATGDLQEGVRDAHLVILATPVRAILEIIHALPRLRPDGCYLLDLGSTKRAICAAMDELPPTFSAIGGHPMCGKENAGLAHATPTLYQDQTFILCPTQRTDEALATLAHALIERIGAAPLLVAAEEHDQLVAVVSHLPYLVAATLMQLAAGAAQEREKLWQVSAAGFRDTSRLAGSEPRMMGDILRTNQGAILAALRQYAGTLQQLIALLESEDGDALESWLQARWQEHEAYRRGR